MLFFTKNAIACLLILICWVGASYVCAQTNATGAKITEGKVKFKLDYVVYSDELKGNEELKSLLPKEFVLYFNGRQNRTEISGMEMGKMIILTNAETGDITTLLDLPGQKVALEQKGKDSEAQNEELLKTMTVQETQETKTIAGYRCKKAIVSYQLDSVLQNVTIYYSPDLPACNNQDFPKVNGFLMEYEEDDEDGTRVKATVTEIVTEKVGIEQFKIPEGYQTISEEEFIEAIGK